MLLGLFLATVSLPRVYLSLCLRGTLGTIDGVDYSHRYFLDNISFTTLDHYFDEEGWTRCYFEPYHDPTSLSVLTTNCPTGDGYSLFIGAYDTSDELAYGAYAPGAVLTTTTNSTTTAYLPSEYLPLEYLLSNDWFPYQTSYDVRWYNYPNKSFGFIRASRVDSSGNFVFYSNINLSDVDITFGNSVYDHRLSWYMDRNIGGYRAPVPGNIDIENLTNSNSWYKMIYYKYCGESPQDIRETMTSQWEDVYNEIKVPFVDRAQPYLIAVICITVFLYSALIVKQVIDLRKDETAPQKQSVLERYAMPIVTGMSLLAAYDLLGDVFYLSFIPYTVYAVVVKINMPDDGLVGCAMNANDGYYYLCEPFQSEPKRYKIDELVANGWEYDISSDKNEYIYDRHYNSSWSTIPRGYYAIGDEFHRDTCDLGEWRSEPQKCNGTRGITVVYGASCHDVFHDRTLYTGKNSELFINLDKCLHHMNGCDLCPQTCGFNDLYEQSYCVENRCQSSGCWNCQRVYAFYIRDAYGGGSYGEFGVHDKKGMLQCYQHTVGELNDFDGIVTYGYYLLAAIVLKEIIKMIFIISFFLTAKAQTAFYLRVSINSPLAGIMIVFSERFRKRITEIKTDKVSKRTCGLLMDMLFENIPALFIPLYLQMNSDRWTFMSILSLSGSILMIVKSVVMLIRYMRHDYQQTLEQNMAQHTAHQTAVAATSEVHRPEVELQNTDEFKAWFYSNVEKDFGTEDTDKYYNMLVDNGFDNFNAFKTISHDELNAIGITKLGHKKVAIACAQNIE